MSTKTAGGLVGGAARAPMEPVVIRMLRNKGIGPLRVSIGEEVTVAAHIAKYLVDTKAAEYVLEAVPVKPRKKRGSAK